MYAAMKWESIARLCEGFWPDITIVRLIDTVLFWSERARQRRRLAELDSLELADIGLSRGQALAEHCKPFWRS